MKGVFFGKIHSYNDLNLILAPFTPTPAKPKTNYLKVPGMDGILDLTEANGEVKFESREFEFVFTINQEDEKTFDEKVLQVSNALNGRKFKITLDRDLEYYWLGRCVVDKYAQNKNIGQIVVKATVQPYKLKQSATEKTVALSSSNQSITLENSRMPAVPTIECTDNNAEVTFGGVKHVLSSGTQKVLGIRLTEGSNELTVKGSGTIKFTWQEGDL